MRADSQFGAQTVEERGQGRAGARHFLGALFWLDAHGHIRHSFHRVLGRRRISGKARGEADKGEEGAAIMPDSALPYVASLPLILELAWEFFKVGLFAVGGGLATLPFLYELADKSGWFTGMDIANMIAVSESTPGPIGINMATYVGYTTAGAPGAALASLALVAPSLIVIAIIAKVMQKYRESEAVQDIFYGLRPASVALIAAAALEVAKASMLSSEKLAGALDLGGLAGAVSLPCVGLAAAALFLTRKFKKMHPVFLLAGSAGAGMLLGVFGLL
jgi:chromate transporter